MYGAPIAPTAQTVSPFAQEFVETGPVFSHATSIHSHLSTRVDDPLRAAMRCHRSWCARERERETSLRKMIVELMAMMLVVVLEVVVMVMAVVMMMMNKIRNKPLAPTTMSTSKPPSLPVSQTHSLETLSQSLDNSCQSLE
eukprot:879932-Rhodomonas_salina.4